MIQENLNSAVFDPDKPLVAIETSGFVCGVSVFYNPKKYYSSKLILKYSHSEKLFALLQSVLNSADLQFNEISAIAVSSGPGSFTGLRIGMSAVKGISFPNSIPVIPVPTFEAMALQILSFSKEGLEFCIANKVGKDEAYFAKFQISNNNYIFKEELKIIPISQLSTESENILKFGDAFIGIDETNKINFSAPDPEYVALWAKLYGDKKLITELDFLEPNYIKNFIVKEKQK